MKNLIPLLLIMAFVICNGSCSKPKGLDYIDFKNLRVLELGSKESFVSLDIQYFNPNNFNVQMKDAAVEVYINDKHLGRSTLDTLYNIPQKDTFLLPVTMKVDMRNLFSNLLQIITNPEVKVKLEGNAKVGRGGIFFNYPIQYEGMQKIKF